MNKSGGCLTFVIGFIILALVIQVIKFAFLNILGIIGIIIAIVGIYFSINKKTTSGYYWPVVGIITGFLLTIFWFSFKEPLNTLGSLSAILLLYFIVTTAIFAIRKNTKWKQFSIISTSFLVFMIILFSVAPELETNKSEVATADIKSDQLPTEQTRANNTEDTIKNSEQEKDDNISTNSSVTNNEDKESNAVATSQSTKNTDNLASDKKNRIPVTLTKTVDGDTIKVMYKGKEETVRYLLIDTPESKKPNTCVQPYAEKASERNKQLVNSGRLTLEFEKSERDKYDRLLAYVFVNGISVQETLLKEGYARVAYIYEPPYKYLSKYEKAEDIAQQQHTNIWSQSGLVTESGFVGCASKAVADSSTKSNSNTNKNSVATTTTPKPSNNTGNSNAFQNDPSDDQESNTSCKGKIKGNANSKIYHVPGGAYYDKTQDNIVWFCSASDAEAAGYRASKR